MKNSLIFLSLMLILVNGFSKDEISDRKEHKLRKAEKNNIKPEIKNGNEEILKKAPSGIGGLKLGITKSEVESLQEVNGAYLSSPLTEHSIEYIPEEIGEYFADVKIPLSIHPIKTKLTFKDNYLFIIEMDLKQDEALYKNILAQITKKYGDGKIDNSRKKEMCLYKSGANFEIDTGSIVTSWAEDIGQDKIRLAMAWDSVSRRCPENLMYGSVRERISYRIHFYGQAAKSKELF